MRQNGINACYFAKMHNIIPPFDNSKVDIFFYLFYDYFVKIYPLSIFLRHSCDSRKPHRIFRAGPQVRRRQISGEASNRGRAISCTSHLRASSEPEQSPIDVAPAA